MQGTYYRVAYRKKKTGSIIEDTKTEFVGLKNSWRSWAADPFIIKKDGRTYVFAELYDYIYRIGTIGYCEILPDGRQTKWQTVIREKYHMSYPQPFEYSGNIYLVPESALGLTLCAYRAVDFPKKWEKVHTFVSGEGYADMTFVSYGGKPYALGCSIKDPPAQVLRLFELDEENHLNESEISPVVDDVTLARPGGHFFTLEEKLYRASQDCEKCYGNMFNIIQVDSDFKTYYNEKLIKKIGIDDITVLGVKAPECTHTYNSNDEYEVIDILAENRNVLNYVGRIAAKIVRKLFGFLMRR